MRTRHLPPELSKLKRLASPSVSEVVEELNPCILLVEAKIGTVTLENELAVSAKTDRMQMVPSNYSSSPYWSSPKRETFMCPQRHGQVCSLQCYP